MLVLCSDWFDFRLFKGSLFDFGPAGGVSQAVTCSADIIAVRPDFLLFD